MTAGNGTLANHEFAHVAQRLASFAAGCLGTSSPAKTGNRLGVMGNVSEAELHEILHHIEVLSKQRAVGLAGQAGGGYPESESTDRHGTSFRQALKEACGVDAEHIHLYLPKDSVGKVDLLQIFRMEDGKVSAGPATAPSCDAALADFVDDPKDLPKASEMPKLSDEVDQANWLQDTVAINTLRSALVHHVTVEDHGELLLPLSKRCRSRRPALSKTALRALAELSDTGPSASSASSSAWLLHGAELVTGCLAAMQVTKVTAKMGEETLNALCRRLQKEANTAKVLQVLCSLQGPEVRQPGHPSCVAALLRVMGSCLSSGVPSDGDEMTDATAAVSAFCEEVLKTRRLSPAFSEARAVLRQLAEGPSASGERQN